MRQVILFCTCSMLAQADYIDEIRFIPFDGMSNTHYSVDAEMHLLQISYQKGIARVLGEFPVRSAVSAWYCPRYETIFWLEPIAESSQGITPCVLKRKKLDSDHISQWDLTFMIGGDEVIQPLGERWLALFQPYAFSAVFDFETEVLHRGVPGFVAQYGSRYTSVIGESAYFGAGYNQFRFSKVALPSGKVLIDTSGPEDMRALDAGEYVSVVGLHGPLALLSCGIRGEAWRKYCAFDMENERLGEFSNKVNLYLYSDYAVREKETGLIEFTYISLTKLSSAMSASPEPPSGELLRACIDPSSLEVTFPQRVDYDSRNEIAIITDSGEVEIFPRHLFNYVPMRWGFLSRQGQNAPHSESREERVKAQQEFLDSQVGKSIPVTLYGREFNYQVRHLEIVGKNVECKRP